MIRIDTLQGAHPQVVAGRGTSASKTGNSRTLATSPDRHEIPGRGEPIAYEQRLDAVGTTMDLSPIAPRDMLFPSQPGTPPSEVVDNRYGAVTPPPERRSINVKSDITPPKRPDIRYGAVTPPPGMADRHNQRGPVNHGTLAHKKTTETVTH